jgi:hypothetical protein
MLVAGPGPEEVAARLIGRNEKVERDPDADTKGSEGTNAFVAP